MNKISKILIPFGFSESSGRAVEYAVAFAKKGPPTEIILLYVADQELSSEERQELENRFSKIRDQYYSRSDEVDLTHQIETGKFVENILQSKVTHQAELIIMGTHGADEDSEELDTNASRLVHQADCPILVIPESFEGFKIENITLAIDKNKIEDPDTLGTLLVIARRFNAKINALTIYEEGDEDYLGERKNESTLRYYFDRYYARNSSIVSPDIAQSIMDYGKRRAIDLLAIIPRNHNKGDQRSQGRLTRFLTKYTEIPVLIID